MSMNREQASRLKITAHATATMEDRGIEIEEVVAALLGPDVIEPHEGRERYVRDGIAAVVAWEGPRPVLVTVLLRRRETWSSADARSR